MLLQQAATGVEQNHLLAERAVTKLYGGGGETEISHLAAWISTVERQYYDWHRERSATPLVDEIVTRTAPLHDQWDARGPGMLREIGRLTDPRLVADRADVVMVLPVLGGDGHAHLPANLVTFEAMLTNADESLPEVMRLAWLLAQLQFDLPVMTGSLPPRRLPHVAQVAMLPPVLQAGAEVELCAYNERTLAAAALLWRAASTEEEATNMAQTSWQWWSTYQSSPVRWQVASAALAEMLAHG